MTEREAFEAVGIALAACPSHSVKLTKQDQANMVKAWALLLADLDASDVKAALLRFLGSSKWLPSPAELRGIVAESKHGRRRPGADAWGDVLRAVSQFGSYRSPTFADPLVARAVDALGWRELCLSENAVSDRARFVELYDRLASAAAEDRAVASLPGAARPALPGRTGPTQIGPAILQLAKGHADE